MDLIALEDTVVSAYYKNVPGAQDTTGLWVFPCQSTLPDLYFTNLDFHIPTTAWTNGSIPSAHLNWTVTDPVRNRKSPSGEDTTQTPVNT